MQSNIFITSLIVFFLGGFFLSIGLGLTILFILTFFLGEIGNLANYQLFILWFTYFAAFTISLRTKIRIFVDDDTLETKISFFKDNKQEGSADCIMRQNKFYQYFRPVLLNVITGLSRKKNISFLYS